MRLFLYIFFTLLSLNLSANQHINNSMVEECYASAMIGYDYVINSRVGLPMERALNTVTVNQNSAIIKDVYKFHLRSIVENAYQWSGSPHEFAVLVLFNCAFEKGRTDKVL